MFIFASVVCYSLYGLLQIVLLLYILSNSQPTNQHILPSVWNELIGYLNLPDIHAIDALVTSSPSFDFLLKLNMNAQDFFMSCMQHCRGLGEKNQCMMVIRHSIQESSLFVNLPQDIRVLNNYYHRFVTLFL